MGIDGHDRVLERGAERPADRRRHLRLANDVDVIAATLRTQTFHPDTYTQFGIDLAAKRYILVKSSQHYRAGFGPIAAEIMHVAAPGAITPDFANIPYEKLSSHYWPRVEDPFTDSE